ncbi:protein jag [bacterium C-53]|nr:protein jag [Lachnospiraceae bacterium]NBI03106.1 protein jag [Lachnospiraceae bacterium]RKJ10713.1 protein jag [bacterium C-53]
MDFIEVTGKTVEDAITEACRKLTVTSDHLEYEVIDKGNTGFLGFNSKPAIIKARAKVEIVEDEEVFVKPEVSLYASDEKKESVKPVSKDKLEQDVTKFLLDVFKAMKMEVNVKAVYSEKDVLMDVELSGDEMGVLIGKRGQTLDSLQYLVSLVVNKEAQNYIRVKVDTEDYRRRRKATLENLAKNLAYKVKRTKRPVSLEPMNPYERRIIHSALQNDRYVTTHSEGEEPYRRVVITLKK